LLNNNDFYFIVYKGKRISSIFSLLQRLCKSHANMTFVFFPLTDENVKLYQR
jgi:hypothetical protein